MGLSSIMHIGLTGMFAAGASMQTSSHNIANASTPGFSRQRTMTGSARAVNMSYGILGSGTQVTDIRRQTDQFLVDRQRYQSSLLSQYETQDMTLGNVETIFGSVDNNHLGDALTRFFSAWSSLATPPHNDTLRQDVLGSAERVVLDLQSMSQSLEDLARDMDDQMISGVDELNRLLTAVSDLNRQVLLGETSQHSANDLRDQRDQVLARVAELARTDVIERDDGTVDVIISGRTLVTREHVQHLEVRHDVSEDGRPGSARVTVQDGRYELKLPPGALLGYKTSRDDLVVDTRARLDDLARTLIERVNELHVQGRSDGGRGLIFFTGDSATTIGINSALVENPSYIATSRSNLPGDADIAQEIAELGQAGTDVADGRSMTELFTALVVDIASDSAASRYRVDGQQQMVDTLTSRLESVRGVSLDEEAANIALYQNAYQANARVIAAVQDMFEAILTMV
jgi:flagellar hook-associated protein 1 FlgK